jgi:hypothetical protein
MSRARECPPAVGILLLDIEAETFQQAFRGVIHFKGKAELLGNLPAVIDEDRKLRPALALSAESGADCGDSAINAALASDNSDRTAINPWR